MKTTLITILLIIAASSNIVAKKVKKQSTQTQSSVFICSPFWHSIRSNGTGEEIGRWRKCSWGRETQVYK
ncbi:MAG: hypothetical protein ACK4R6_06330 [Spirosomataceae bacterium]|jgi:hypothetical protein